MKDTIREKAYLNMNKYPNPQIGIIIKLLENDIFDLGYNSCYVHQWTIKIFKKELQI